MRKFKVIRRTVKVTEDIKFGPGDEFSDEEDLFCIEAHRRNRIINVLLDSGQVKEKFDDIDSIIHLGAGWYELPDGSRVRGKDNALKAL